MATRPDSHRPQRPDIRTFFRNSLPDRGFSDILAPNFLVDISAGRHTNKYCSVEKIHEAPTKSTVPDLHRFTSSSRTWVDDRVDDLRGNPIGTRVHGGRSIFCLHANSNPSVNSVFRRTSRQHRNGDRKSGSTNIFGGLQRNVKRRTQSDRTNHGWQPPPAPQFSMNPRNSTSIPRSTVSPAGGVAIV